MRECRSRWLLLVILAALGACRGDEEPASGVPPAVTPPAPAPPALVDTGPWTLDIARGQAIFAERCQRCHGQDAAGGYGPPLNSSPPCLPCAAFTSLWQRIDGFMPLRNPQDCDLTCARDVAAWIRNGLSTTPSCSVAFRFDDVSAGRFTATIRIGNHRGLVVPTWRLGFTLPAGHNLSAANGVVAEQSDRQVLIRPTATSEVIANGAFLEFLLEGTHGGQAVAPADLRLEADPCFTAVPG